MEIDFYVELVVVIILIMVTIRMKIGKVEAMVLRRKLKDSITIFMNESG